MPISWPAGCLRDAIHQRGLRTGVAAARFGSPGDQFGGGAVADQGGSLWGPDLRELVKPGVDQPMRVADL